MITQQQLDFKTIKPRIFIIEGPDCSGKTTLARAMANTLNAAYFHATFKAAPQSQVAYELNILDNAEICRSVSGLHVVLDRHWPSEQIYGDVLRKKVTPGLNSVFSQCVFMNVVYVFCTGDLNRYLLNVDSDHPYTDEQYLALQYAYCKLEDSLRRDGGPIFTYNMKAEGVRVTDFVGKMLYKLQTEFAA